MPDPLNATVQTADPLELERAEALARARRQWVVGLAALAAALVLMYVFLDRPAAWWARGLPRPFRVAANEATKLAHGNVLITLPAVLLAAGVFLKRKVLAARAAALLAAVLGTGLAVVLLKMLLGARPNRLFKSDQYGFEFFATDYGLNGFPSGHSSNIGAVAAAVCIFAPRLRIPAALVAVALGSTRVFTCSHYPSDVLAGLFVGATGTVLITRAFQRKGLPVELPAYSPRPSTSTSCSSPREE